jgi:hypothetical protein
MDVKRMAEQLSKKLDKNGLEAVYNEMNRTVIDKYFEKFTVSQIKKHSEDRIIKEVEKIFNELIDEVPFNLLQKKMTSDDFCFQVALITKFIQQ